MTRELNQNEMSIAQWAPYRSLLAAEEVAREYAADDAGFNEVLLRISEALDACRRYRPQMLPSVRGQ